MDTYNNLPKATERTLYWLLCENEVTSWRLFGEEHLTLSIRFGQKAAMSTPSHVDKINIENVMHDRSYRLKPPSSILRDNSRQQAFIEEEQGQQVQGHEFDRPQDHYGCTFNGDSSVFSNLEKGSQNTLPTYDVNDNAMSMDTAYTSSPNPNCNNNGISSDSPSIHLQSGYATIQTDPLSHSKMTQTETHPVVLTSCAVQHPLITTRNVQTEKLSVSCKEMQTKNIKLNSSASQCNAPIVRSSQTMTETKTSSSIATLTEPPINNKAYANIYSKDEKPQK